MAISQEDRDWFCDRLRENWESLYRLCRSITGSDTRRETLYAIWMALVEASGKLMLISFKMGMIAPLVAITPLMVSSAMRIFAFDPRAAAVAPLI